MKPIVSFTLFGTDMKYYVGAIKNAETVKTFLPEWQMRIYYHSDSVLTNYLSEIEDLGVNLLDVKNITLGGVNSLAFPYFWRFLSFLENTPSIVRDLDSRFSRREVDYIQRWIESGCDYFIIRDHPWHSPVPSGLFGIKRKIDLFEYHLNEFIKNNDLVWGSDQTILQNYIMNINKSDIYYCGYDDPNNYLPRDDKNFFIGMQIDENDNPLNPSAFQALNYINEIGL